MMNIGYARVSGATGQEGGLETQIAALESAGCERIYSESISGKNKDRPELQSMIKALRKGDVITIPRLTAWLGLAPSELKGTRHSIFANASLE